MAPHRATHNAALIKGPPSAVVMSDLCDSGVTPLAYVSWVPIIEGTQAPGRQPTKDYGLPTPTTPQAFQ